MRSTNTCTYFSILQQHYLSRKMSVVNDLSIGFIGAGMMASAIMVCRNASLPPNIFEVRKYYVSHFHITFIRFS
jgi:hypothetical protein